MNRVHRIVIVYFLAALPVTAALVFTKVNTKLQDLAATEAWADWLNGAWGLAFGLWMLSALYLGIALVSSAGFRENFLRKLLKVKDRDEREAMITAVAARRTFFSSIAVTTLLLILTMFQVNIRPLQPEEIRPGGGTKMLSLGLKFSPWKTQGESADSQKEVFAYDFPITSSGVLLLLLVWQVGAFSWSCRRESVNCSV